MIGFPCHIKTVLKKESSERESNSCQLRKVKFKYCGYDIDAVLDRLPTATILSEECGVYTVEVEVFGTGIDMWLRSQGDLIEVIT